MYADDLYTSLCDRRALMWMGRGWEPWQLDPADGTPTMWEICDACWRMAPYLLERIDLDTRQEVRVCERCADTQNVGYCDPIED